VEALFNRFRKLYGYDRFWKVFISPEICAEAKRDWAEELGENMTGEQVKIALEACQQDFKWPPCPAEFKQRAKSPPPAHRQYKALPSVKPHKELGQQACRTMKEILADHEAGELIPEHRAMLAQHNPELLARIEANYPKPKSEVEIQ